MPLQSIAAAFQRHFGHEPLLVRAPGRVNLIGEHTDYNGGFVLPAAIDKEIYFAVALNGGTTARLHSYDLDESYATEIANIHRDDTQWANYLKGVVAQFQKRGIEVPGFDCMFGGNIPIGAGLSSSAAVECGLGFALNQLLGTNIERMDLAKMGQQAEHEYAGVRSGLMDQFASLFGRPGNVVRLDCRSLDYEYFPFSTDTCHIVLCNSGVKHALASSEYNTRREECEQGVALLQKHYPHLSIKTLRDVTREQVETHRTELGDVVYRRCRYVVDENARVESACNHLLQGNLQAFGQDMYGSHAGLRDDYEVSCRELDTLVDTAKTLPGVFGARMMGGGFGGCTINLVAVDQVDNFVEAMTQAYQDKLQLTLETYKTTIVGGVEAVASPK